METTIYLDTIKKILTQKIKEHIKIGLSISESDYMDQALMCLKNLSKGEGPTFCSAAPKRKLLWTPKELMDISKLWNKIYPEIEKHVNYTLKHHRARKMVTEIRQLTAKAKIEKAMQGTNLKYFLILQTYRAKIAVKIGSKNKVVFYVSYKKTDDDLHRNIIATQSMIKLLESMGSGASVQRLMPYENWR